METLSISKKSLDKDSLFISFNESSTLDIYKDEKNLISIILYKNTGLSLPKNTVINSKRPRNILFLEINSEDTEEILCDVVGPVCECSDFLGKDRKLSVKQNDILIISSCGAYASSMSSNYNSRPRPAEVIVKKGQAVLISKKEEISDLYSREIII